MTTYRPRIKRKIDPIYSLAEDLVQLEDVERLRLDNTYGEPDERQRQLARRMKLGEELIQKIITATACSHLEASTALHKAIQRAVKRKDANA